jgi:amino acid permease
MMNAGDYLMRFVLAVPLLLNCESHSAAFVIPVSRPLPVTLYARNDNSSSSNRDTTIASQAALIAGTTIGGGFLALPAATSTCGAAPAAVGLVGVWLFLLGGALSLSNAIFMLKRNSPQKEVGEELDNVSLFSLVRACFGNATGILVGFVFLLLIKVTLVAQLSKIGVLLNAVFPVFSRHVWTAIFSISIAAFCILGTKRRIETTNDALTATMLISFSTLVLFAGGSGWSIDGLKRANYNSLLPSSRPWSIPIFIQLLIYNEVVPLVASRLNDEGKVRKAIMFGSLIPLGMCLTWSCVALGLVLYEPSLVASGMIYDPLTILRDIVLSKGTLVGKAFLVSVNTLAGSAICTTVIGSMLASTQYFDDILANMVGGRGRTSDRRISNVSSDHNSSIQRKILVHALALCPSAFVALLGSSHLYYHATSFAGEFPCTFLYGLVPPLCNLRLRYMHKKNEGSKSAILQIVLVLLSSSIVVNNIFL